MLRVQFVTTSWPDIRENLEKMEDWQEKGINELLREALKIYLRREEKKTKSKPRIMVVIAKESLGVQTKHFPERSENRPKPSIGTSRSKVLPPWVNEDRKPGVLAEIRTCYYCGEVGHIRKDCNKHTFDQVIEKEQDALEKILRGDD